MDISKRSINSLTNLQSLMMTADVALSREEITRLLLKEGLTDEKHLNEDAYTAFVALNTWCCLYLDITNRSRDELATRIRLNGISQSIREAEDYHFALTKGSTDSSVSSFWFSKIGEELTEKNLLITGFPKRMRIVGRDLSFMYGDYTSGNRRCRNHQKGSYSTDMDLTYEEYRDLYPYTPNVLLDRAREIINIIVKDWSQDQTLFVLPPGATYEGCHTYLEKFKVILGNQQWLRDRGVNIPFIFGYSQKDPADVNRYVLVPKNFEKGRGVAPEPVARQVLGYQVDAGLRKCLKHWGIDLNDQSVNKMACSDAFRLGLATVDYSSASDSISYFLVVELFKDNPLLLARLKDCRTNFITVKGNIIENGRFATMGNAITFSLESTIFLAIGSLAVSLEHPDWQLEQCIRNVLVYGDDVIIPDDCFSTLTEISRLFGFTVNQEKSFFGDDNYRESCGSESIRVLDSDNEISTIYIDNAPRWPRGTSNIPIAEVISLQHKLVSYDAANTFLIRCILDLYPEMTQSSIGSTHYDIWCDFPEISVKGCSRYARFTHNMDYYQIVPKNGMKLVGTNEDLLHVHIEGFLTKIIVSPMSSCDRYIAPHHWSEPLLSGKPVDVRQLSPILPPHDDNYEVHVSIETQVGGKAIPSSDRDLVELLMYLLTIGSGVEHINSSDYTKAENMIRDRRDLVYSRKPKITKRSYLV